MANLLIAMYESVGCIRNIGPNYYRVYVQCGISERYTHLVFESVCRRFIVWCTGKILVEAENVKNNTVYIENKLTFRAHWARHNDFYVVGWFFFCCCSLSSFCWCVFWVAFCSPFHLLLLFFFLILPVFAMIVWSKDAGMQFRMDGSEVCIAWLCQHVQVHSKLVYLYNMWSWFLAHSIASARARTLVRSLCLSISITIDMVILS